jgi:O-glycosyl hydrolase
MGNRVIKRMANATMAAVFLFFGSILPVLGFNLATVSATPDVAQVYLTLADQSKLVQQQADVPFSTNLAPQTGDLSVRVDPTKTFQTMDGVGAAMTESSAYLFSTKLTARQRSLVFPSLFSKQYGAGIDVVRVPWGLTDFSLSNYTYNDNPPGGTDAPQNNFSINHDQQYIMPRLTDAKSVNPSLKIFNAPWSAPLWMKSSPFPDHPYAVGPLKTEFFDSYGTYVVKAINGYAANNLTPHAVTAQNEPFTPTFNPSMLFAPNVYQQLLRDNVGPKVAANAVKPKLLSHDEDWQDERDTGNPTYPLATLSDPNAAQYIDGVAYHCYHGESTKQLLVQKAYPAKGIYVTECTGSNTPPQNWDDDFRWGMRNMIINPMRHYAKASIYWNLALDETAGPKTSTTSGCQNCRGIITINSTTGAVSAGPEYYILAHYGKVVSPGASRIDSTTYGEGAIETVAFKNPNGSKALVALNSGATSRTMVVREGNAAFRYTLPAWAAASFTWTMADNTNRDVDNTGRFEAEDYSSSTPASQPFLNITDEGKADKAVQLANNENLKYDNVSFAGTPLTFQMRYATLFSGTIEFHLDSATGPLLASIPFSPNNYTKSGVVAGSVTPSAGAHNLYIVAKGSGTNELINLNWIKFAENGHHPDPIAGKANWKAYALFGGGTTSPSNVLDNNNDTRWTMGWPMTYGHFFTIDFGKQTALDAVGAYSANGDRPRHVKVEVSDNGLDYTVVQPDYSPPADLYQIPLTAPAMGRYLRMTELSDTPVGNWWSINDVNMYYH